MPLGFDLPDSDYKGLLMCPHCEGRMYGCILTKKYGWILACAGDGCRKVVTRVSFPDDEGTSWEPVWVGKVDPMNGLEGLE